MAGTGQSRGSAALLRPAQVADRLGCSEWWVKEQARRRRVPHVRVAGSYRFTEEHVAEIIRRFEVVPVDEIAAPVVAVARPQQTEPDLAASRLRARAPQRAPRVGNARPAA
ncbi:helix-turn-helix domain-containing protein [Dactylosporangium sp. AC04546]|uniref:helix-turn-helix domain-containing protein n=1 Tax=Dactylosporangium sp. AC04546 TaxID=2862460 RepID=UPI001EE14A4B|nr:helix-turn-helix domain-containing protein [Dactylosporangium sp. AC04546]WVK82019.1 helix-turn-helix domain-containing protein [Dactylosporangium sp. AC04546]